MRVILETGDKPEVRNLIMALAECGMGIRIDDHQPAGPAQSQPQPHGGEELFHFIHPAIDSSREWQVHLEVKRLVTSQKIPDICSYLQQMAVDGKILLPQMPSVVYGELVRMGMPSGRGYSIGHFKKYYCK